MTDEIKYEDMQDKKIPDFVDPETKMLKDAAVKGIESQHSVGHQERQTQTG